jgi:GT2 family glycosyltransferase
MVPTIRIVIVNWNGGLQLWDCLQSILTADEEGFVMERVVVVDNASTDGSATELDDIDLPLHLI